MQRSTLPKQQFGLPDIGIPAEILFHPKLSNTEKILFGLIRNLAHGEKGCYASNSWLVNPIYTIIYIIVNVFYKQRKIKYINKYILKNRLKKQKNGKRQTKV